MPFSRRRAEAGLEAPSPLRAEARSPAAAPAPAGRGRALRRSPRNTPRSCGAGHAIDKGNREALIYPRAHAGPPSLASARARPNRRQSGAGSGEVRTSSADSAPAASRPRTTASLQAAWRATSARGREAVRQDRRYTRARRCRLDGDRLVGLAQGPLRLSRRQRLRHAHQHSQHRTRRMHSIIRNNRQIGGKHREAAAPAARASGLSFASYTRSRRCPRQRPPARDRRAAPRRSRPASRRIEGTRYSYGLANGSGSSGNAFTATEAPTAFANNPRTEQSWPPSLAVRRGR